MVIGPHEAFARRWGWLVITLAVLLTYWPLASFQYSVSHGDTLNCWLPWRAFITQCLNDGHFPLWNPHQQFGYPMHADLQGPTWYIESLAIGGTIGHSIYTLQALFLLYLIIGGLGMMCFVRTLFDDARIGLIIGVAYALGGFFTGHQMHFYAVISAAWLPWLFDAAVRLFREPGWTNAARVALFQGLLLTGGNHTFTIIGGYVLFALFAAHAWERWRSDRWNGVRLLLGWCAIAAIGAAMIAAGVLHAWWETGPLLARAGGLSYAAAAVDPTTPRSLISLLFPYATGTDMEFLGTDSPMANAYMGALLLPLAFASLLRKRSMIENVLLVVGVLSAIAALGDLTPVHRWLWSFVPGMDLFRFPAYFRWFTWLAVLVLAAGTLRAYWANELRRGWSVGLWVITTLAIALAVHAFVNAGSDGESFTFFERMRAMDLHHRIVLSAAVTIPLLLITIVLAWRRELSFPILLGIVLLEMGWNTSLAQWNTAVSDIKPHWLHDRISSLSDGPIIPEMVPTSTYNDNGTSLHYLAHNTQDFLGGFSRNGVNSFWLKNAMALEVEHTNLWNAMSKQPVVYLADSIIPWSAYRKEAVDTNRDSGLVVLASGSPLVFAQPRSTGDRAEVIGFDPDRFVVECKSERPVMLVLQQSHYPGWEVNVDGTPAPLLHVNIAAMAVEVPAGEHKVEFRYRKPIVPWLLAISLITFFGLLFALVFGHHPTWTMKAPVLALAGAVCWSLFAHTPKRERVEVDVLKLVTNIPDNAAVVMNDDRTLRNPLHGDMNGWSIRADKGSAAGSAIALLSAAHDFRSQEPGLPDGRPLYWVDGILKAHPDVRAAILDHFMVLEKKERNGSVLLHLDPRTSPANWRLLFQQPDTNSRWLTNEAPFGSGCTIALDELVNDRNGSIVVDLLAGAPTSTEAVIVVERKHGEKTTDYRALPVRPSTDPHERSPLYATIPVDELYRPGDELKIYLWSHHGDSISEEGFRVRVAPRTFYAW
ncbi:MAG: hypothetical protein IT226_08885 [Flavobacteriales bacterium]|nr:hypothetical protein [Flavobacteriales bacterium]